MVNETVIVTNEEGLHLRPAGEFAKLASSFQSEVTIRAGRKSIDGRKVVSILSGGIKQGDKIKIYCDGDDEDEALEALMGLLKK